MAEYLIQEETLKAIADAIRGKTGSTESMTLLQMLESLEPLADVSSVTAKADGVLKGQKFVNSSGVVVDGTILKRSKFTGYIDRLNTTYTIPQGYYEDSKVITSAMDKTVTPTKQIQEITTMSDVKEDCYSVIDYNFNITMRPKFLNSVTVNPIPDQYQDVTNVTATADSVREGQVFVDASGVEQVGTLALWEGGSY